MQSIANDLIETWKLKDFTGGRPSHRNVDPQRWTFEYFFVGFHLGQSLATPKPVNGSDMFPWKRCTENMFESRWCQRFSQKKAGATHHYHDDIWWLITYIYIIIIYYHISPKKDTTFGTSRVIHCWRTAIWCRCFWSLRPCAIAKRRGCVTVKMGSFPVGDRNNQSMFNLGCNNPWCLDVQYRMTINNIAS
jgi:hypothetical protein